MQSRLKAAVWFLFLRTCPMQAVAFMQSHKDTDVAEAEDPNAPQRVACPTTVSQETACIKRRFLAL